MTNKLLTLGMLFVASIFLTNCAKSGNSARVAATNLCATPGYVSTTAGCVPQGSCQVGYGQYGNQCLPATAMGAVGNCPVGQVPTQHGCLPQSSSCPANNGYYNGSCYPMTSGYNGYNGYNGYSGGACSVGQVGTAMGCLPQHTCPAGYGYSYGTYNGQVGGWCYPRTY